ncbi:DUF2946 family protein [Sphingomonas sp. 1P06PA]|uniref:hypothetical protein n=1 Tax=Sphingomonas sp. 1P06PA TaxID=554121 RepID=UPI0039A62585
MRGSPGQIDLLQAFRRHILAHRSLCGLLIALALAMKLLVPTGFMPTVAGGQIVVTLCSGSGPVKMMMTLPGTGHHDADDHGAAKHEPPCAFSGLTMPALSGADPVLLTAQILFAMVLALHALVAIPLPARSFLRPPLRAPPLSA